LEITLEKKSEVEGIIKMQIAEPDYQKALDDKIKEYGKKAKINGFRPGKVPSQIIRKMYGKALKAEEINQLISSSLSGFIKEKELALLGEPVPLPLAEEIDWDTQNKFVFEFEVGLAGQFEVQTQKVKTSKYEIKIEDQVVADTLNELRERFAENENPEEVGTNDMLYGELKSVSSSYQTQGLLPLSKVSLSESSKIEGSKKGDTLRISLSALFGNDESGKSMFTGIIKEELGDHGDEFEFSINNITRKSPAKLDQKFFDQVFGPSVVDGEAAFMEKLKETIEENYKREAAQLFQQQIKKEITQNTNISLPDEFLKKWLINKNKGKVDEGSLMNEYPKYVESLKWNLIRDYVAKKSAISVTEQDVFERAKSIIESQFAQYGMLDQIRAQLDTFAMNYLKKDDGANYSRIYDLIEDQRVLEKLTEEVETKVKKISLEEFKKEIELLNN
jgi:trigger factor